MKTLKLNKARAMSIVVVFSVVASMMFSENPLSYVFSAIFFFIMMLLLMDVALTESKGYPWAVLIFYLFVVVYIFGASLVLFLIVDDFSPRNFLTSLYLPSLLVLSVLLFGKDPKVFNLFLFCFFVFMVFASYKVLEARALSWAEYGRARQTNWTNFVGSSLVFAFAFKRRFLTFALLLVGTFIVVIGLKRSGILVVSLCWMIYFFSFNGVRQFVSGNVMAFLLGGVALAFAIHLFGSEELFSLWDAAWTRMGNITEDGGSGRDAILMDGISFWMNSDFISMFLGHGHAAFQKHVGAASSLHNDFAELLVSYGLIGALFIVTIYARLICLCIKLGSQSNRYFPFSLAVGFSFLIYSNVAGLYFYPIFFCPLIIAYGYLESVASISKSTISDAPPMSA